MNLGAGLNWNFPYPSYRKPVLAANAVATSQPLAAQAGLAMLRAGGNAVDAAIACAITLTVVEPVSNGIGSDAFALIWDGSELIGLNASGRAPLAWHAARFARLQAMPFEGWDAVTVPGAISAWVALSQRFGKLPFADLFAPAIDYAAKGYAVSPTVALQWARQLPRLAGVPGFAEAFMPRGRAPLPGELFANPAQARTLRLIAESRGETFYRGELAEKMVAHSRDHGGALALDDLDRHAVDWVAPISHAYRGYRVHEIPPNGQGIAALLALGMLEQHDVSALPVDSADSLHVQIEAMKLAFADAYQHVADPAFMRTRVSDLLSSDYLARRASLIDLRRAQRFAYDTPPAGGTVYLTAADASGMMASFIQSNYMGFGSGVVVPGTGISLQNRGGGFTLQPGHVNQVAPGKRPFHTIIPAFVTRDGQPLMSFGVMGGDIQPQGHTQIMVRLADYGQNPQAACDAPRWKVLKSGALALEPQIADAVRSELIQRGHVIEDIGTGYMDFGSGQFIHVLESGYLAASDPRRDGQAVGF
jgi:gamma-glutamyltranspeptidase/glutathione hydrolase